MTPQELIERIHTERAAFAALWQSLSPEQMTHRPGPQPDWSVKDLIAHIIWWEEDALLRVTHMVCGHRLPRADDFHAVNVQVFQQNKDRPLDDVLAHFTVSLSALEGQINVLTTAQLNDETLGESPLQRLTTNTVKHYKAHWDDLCTYTERVQP